MVLLSIWITNKWKYKENLVLVEKYQDNILGIFHYKQNALTLRIDLKF